MARTKTSAKVTTKARLTLYMPEDSVQRLKVHAAMTGKDMSDIVTSLVDSQLRDYVVQKRGGRGGESESAEG